MHNTHRYVVDFTWYDKRIEASIPSKVAIYALDVVDALSRVRALLVDEYEYAEIVCVRSISRQ